jgi:hypothetical protein
MSAQRIDLQALPQLQTLFRLLNSGKQLNRIAEPALWLELEQQQADYQALFGALGYSLRMDGRGFAWFHTDEASSATSKTTRQLALLLMAIFDVHADMGKPLQRFTDWRLDSVLLTEVEEQHRALLSAEGLDLDALAGLMDTAVRYGFALGEGNGWRLLPAVYRYLDHIEELARCHSRDEVPSWQQRPDNGDTPPA